MEEKENDIRLLKRMATKLFVKKEGVNVSAPNVIAAIVNAGRQMSLVSDITGKDVAYESLLEAYGAIDNDQVKELVELMNPSIVHSVTGYATDFMDYGRAAVSYQAQKEEYDNLYKQVNVVAESKDKAKSL